MRRSILTLIISSFIMVSCVTSYADLLDDALATVGKSKSDLGFKPKGYWNRYPFEIPYKLPAFDDLFAEPLRVYDYSYSMKAAVEHYLDDSTFSDVSNSALYQLSYHLAWERKVGGFRNYSPNLVDTVVSDNPLRTAIEMIYLQAGTDLFPRSFGQSSEIPELETDSLNKVFTPEIQRLVAVWLVNLLEAAKYHELAFRNVPRETIEQVFHVEDLDVTQGDGQIYYPQFDDCASSLDWQSLVYASYKVIAATDLAAKQLMLLPDKSKIAGLDFDTPLGRILISGNDKDVIEDDDYLLICDFGGDDLYHCGAGSKPHLPISVVVDLGGDDTYGNNHTKRQFGSGICGVGVLIDTDGDDTYQLDRLGQGVGIFGTGVVLDHSGKDDYRLTVSGQGCGYFGVGMLIDREGEDNYYLAGDGMGAGGVGGGIGILVDYKGDDHYKAEPYADVFDRGDYHSGMKINANNAMGWGGGRRGDGSDGHSWAGGMGVLIDCFGDDEYYAGNFSIGVGYWFGIGILYDVNGNDLYKSCYFTQASGAHFCIGAIFDETGDDRHELYETAGAGLAFGWDFSVNLLVDWQGDDLYSGKIISIALSQIRSNAFLFDFGGGDDIYRLNSGTAGMGESSFRESFRTPRPMTPFPSYAQSYGILIDVGGSDQYLDYVDSTESTQPRNGSGNNQTWYRPACDDDRFGYNNYGIGVDADIGTIGEFFIYRKK